MENLRTSFRDAFAACNVAFAREMFQICFRELSRTHINVDFRTFAFATTRFAFANQCSRIYNDNGKCTRVVQS